MRIREDNRNMVLLAAVVAVTIAIAGTAAALFEPATAKQEVASRPAYLVDSTPVRVIGAPFVPNVDPHRR